MKLSLIVPSAFVPLPRYSLPFQPIPSIANRVIRSQSFDININAAGNRLSAQLF